MAGSYNSIMQTVDGGYTWKLKQGPASSVITWGTSWFFNGSSGIVAGSAGNIARTLDGGVTWSNRTLGTNVFYSLFFINNDTGWVVGAAGTIYKTLNGGSTWTAQTSNSTSTLNKVWFSNKDTGFAIGSGSAILRTYNGGNTWQPSTLSLTPTLQDICFINKDTGWIAAGNYAFVTYNKGATWTARHSYPYCTNIYFLNKDTGFCASSLSLLATYNGGINWDTVSNFPSYGTTFFAAAKNALFAMNDNQMIRSLNRGRNWDTLYVRTKPAPNQNLETSHFINAQTGWLLGYNGYITKTTDSARTWTAQSYPTTRPLTSMYALNSDTAWIGGISIFLRTYNGGAVWDSISSTGAPSDIHFFNNDTGLIVRSTSIYRTVNGSITWTSVTPTGVAGTLNDIHFINSNTGFVCGNTGSLFRTDDKGLTWTKITLSVAAHMTRISNWGDTIMIAAANYWYVSTDAGQTWVSRYYQSLSLTDIRMISSGIAIATTTFGNIYKTNNLGVSWHDLASPSVGSIDPWFMYADSGYIKFFGSGQQAIVSGQGNWLLTPSIDSLSLNEVVNTDSIYVVIYGKNFNQYSTPVSSFTNTTITTEFVSPTRLNVKLKSTAKFPVGASTIYVNNRGESAGRTLSKTILVRDTIPSIPSSNLVFSNRDSSKTTATWIPGSGTRRLIVMKKGGPVDRFPSNEAATAYASGSFGLGTNLGNDNYVIGYITGNTTTFTALEPGSNYHIALFELTRTTAPFNYNTTNYITGSFSTSKVYYNKSSGSLDQLSSWSNKSDGSGSSPLNFTDSFTYYMANYNSSPMVAASWTVNGYKSYVVFGNNQDAYNLYILPGADVNLDSMIVRRDITVTCDGGLKFRKSTFSSFSLVQFISTSLQEIPEATYHDLTVTGGNKKLMGNISINNSLSMVANIDCNSNTLVMNSSAELIHVSGSVKGKMSRYFNARPSVAAEELFPLGNGTFFRPLNINFTNSSNSCTVTAEYVDSVNTAAGLPQVDASLTPVVIVNKVAREGFWRVNLNASRTYNLSVTGTGFQGVSDSSKLRLMKRISGGWTLQGTAQTVSGTRNAPIVGRTNISGNAMYTIGSDSNVNPLPVKLSSFAGIRIGNTNKLSWITASEINNKGFYIYRSTDLKNWEEVDFVAGKGTVSTASVYDYHDEINGSETYYYFLRQVDFNGASDQSDIITIQTTEHAISLNVIAPNPAGGNMLSIKAKLDFPAQICIYTPAGVLQQTLDVQSENELDAINIENLKPGLYYLQVKDQVQSNNYKFIRE